MVTTKKQKNGGGGFLSIHTFLSSVPSGANKYNTQYNFKIKALVDEYF